MAVMDHPEVSSAADRRFRPRRVHPRKRDAVRRDPEPGAVSVTDSFGFNAIPSPLERPVTKTKDSINRRGGDDKVGRNPTHVRNNFRLAPLHVDVMHDDVVSNVEPTQYLLEDWVK